MSQWEDYRDEALADWDPPKKKRKKKEVSKKKQAPKISSFEVDGIIDFDGTAYFGTRRLYKVHPDSACAGRHCVIHNPSSHHMRELPLIWNSPETQMERLCEHDCTHPDPDDLLYWTDVANEPWKAHHDCCPHNCCTQKEIEK